MKLITTKKLEELEQRLSEIMHEYDGVIDAQLDNDGQVVIYTGLKTRHLTVNQVIAKMVKAETSCRKKAKRK